MLFGQVTHSPKTPSSPFSSSLRRLRVSAEPDADYLVPPPLTQPSVGDRWYDQIWINWIFFDLMYSGNAAALTVSFLLTNQPLPRLWISLQIVLIPFLQDATTIVTSGASDLPFTCTIYIPYFQISIPVTRSGSLESKHEELRPANQSFRPIILHMFM